MIWDIILYLSKGGGVRSYVGFTNKNGIWDNIQVTTYKLKQWIVRVI